MKYVEFYSGSMSTEIAQSLLEHARKEKRKLSAQQALAITAFKPLPVHLSSLIHEWNEIIDQLKEELS